MKRLWTEGRRKLAYGAAAFVVLVVYAFKSGPTYESFASAIEWWLGLMLAGHITAEKLGKAPGTTP